MDLSRTVSEIEGDFSQIIAKFSHPLVFCTPAEGFSLELVKNYNDGATGAKQNAVADGSGCRPPSVKSLDAHSGARSHAGSGVVRIDLLRFLAGCRKRRLNQ